MLILELADEVTSSFNPILQSRAELIRPACARFLLIHHREPTFRDKTVDNVTNPQRPDSRHFVEDYKTSNHHGIIGLPPRVTVGKPHCKS